MAERDLAAALGYTTNGGIVDALFGDVTGPARVNQNIARQVQRSRQAFARPTPTLPTTGNLFGTGADTLGNRIVEKGLQIYDRFSDRSKMPTNRRVFLETVLDKSQEPITEQSLSANELDALRKIIQKKYEPIQQQLTQYENYLQKLISANEQAVQAKNKDRMLYPEALKRYSDDLQAIRNFRNGVLSQDFLDLTQGKSDYFRQMGLRGAGVKEPFNINPSVTYDDYGIDHRRARTARTGSNPFDSLSTLLGQFIYEAPNGQLVVKDEYDFNPPTTLLTNRQLQSKGASLEGVAGGAMLLPEGGGNALYKVIRDYAGTAIPPGQGRSVRIQLNKLSSSAQPASVEYSDPFVDTTR